jgi:hydroxymethylpyrimidine/phosphomethylpyrimidine kinase
VLTIAGSDSGGGAGIQADLRTIAAYGLHGLSAITAVTAQNSRAVEAIHRVPPDHLLAQLRAVFAEFEVGAVKIGMLGSAAAVNVVMLHLCEVGARNIVLDPVLVSSSGAALLPQRALRLLRSGLIPMVDVLTPNLPEAEALLGRRVRSDADMRGAAADLLALGARAVLLKGGHRRGRTVTDLLVDGDRALSFSHPRLPWPVRGTGCTLASAVACGLALHLPLRDAVGSAEEFLQREMRRARPVGCAGMRAMNPAGARVAPRKGV